MRSALRRAGLVSCALSAVLAGCAEESEVPSYDSPSLGDSPSRAPLVRPDTPGNGLMFNFDPSDVVETHASAGDHFLIHFTRQGANAVPAADANADGTPDFVEEVASVYEDVLAKYHDDMGFRAPADDGMIADNGGDARFDVYLVDFAGQGDGNYRDDKCTQQNPQICAGYMVQENDYKGYGYPSTLVANRILGSHEFFHAVQSAYDNGQGSILAEGSAVWATEQFDPTLKDFEGFLPGYLDNTDRPLDTPLPGAVDPFSYGTGIFFEFLTERYSPDMVRFLLSRCENGANGVADPVWFTELDPLLQDKAQTTFGDAMTEFATWNLFTGKFADPARSYDAGAGYAGVKMTEVAAPYFEDALRVYYASAQYYRVPPGGRAAMTAALVAPESTPDATDGLRLLVATRAGTATAPVKELSDVTAGTDTIDTSAADRLVVVIVSTAQSGNSRKPALCIGTVDEVAACRTAFLGTGAGGTGGTGGSNAGGAGGTTATGGDGGKTVTYDGDCGCSLPGREPVQTGSYAALAAAAILAFRRKKKPSQ
ncbi:MAG: MXAN_6640 family putative metalloprotease [Polyangiaceae bacterium]